MSYFTQFQGKVTGKPSPTIREQMREGSSYDVRERGMARKENIGGASVEEKAIAGSGVPQSIEGVRARR